MSSRGGGGGRKGGDERTRRQKKKSKEISEVPENPYSGRLHPDLDGRTNGPIPASAGCRCREMSTTNSTVSLSGESTDIHDPSSNPEMPFDYIPTAGMVTSSLSHTTVSVPPFLNVQRKDEEEMLELGRGTGKGPTQSSHECFRENVDEEHEDENEDEEEDQEIPRRPCNFRISRQGNSSLQGRGDEHHKDAEIGEGSKGKSKKRALRDEEINWQLKYGVDGGPENPELLTGFLGHVAYYIWQGQERGVLSGHSHADRLSKWKISQTGVQELVDGSGLINLLDCMYENIDMPLISAFVERWHPETNSFHLPFGEMTITLHDVYYLLKIPVEGVPVISESSVEEIQTQMAVLLGIPLLELKKQWKNGTIKFETVKRRLSGDNVNPEAVAKGYILWLLGATLFVDKSGCNLHAHFVPFLQDVRAIREKAWGTAALAYLYRQLGTASRFECKQISGCLALLQSWIYEYFPVFRPQMRPNWSPQYPYAYRWLPRKFSADPKALVSYRHILDSISTREVTWTPFGSSPGDEVQVSTFHGIIHCRTITEPYMPDRVMRQFGYVQVIPGNPFRPRNVCRSINNNRYVCVHESMRELFDQFNHHLYKFGSRSYHARYATEAADNYLPWFLERTHPRVSNDGVPICHREPPPHQMTPTARLQLIGSLLYPLHPEVRSKTDPAEYENNLNAICYHMEDWMPLLHQHRRTARGGRTGDRRDG